MYRRVIANLRWETASKRDGFKSNLSTKLDGIPCYDRSVNHGEDMEGNPTSGVDVRPESDADADDLYSFIKDRMDKIPALTGRVTWHDCKHDEGPPFEPCVVEEKYEV